MNAAINPILSYHRPGHLSLYPMGQSDQGIINSMKLGKSPLRAYARRQSTLIMPIWATQPLLASAS